MATKFYRPTATVTLNGTNYPCRGFSIEASINTFATAEGVITSNEKDGGRFTKEKAISISRKVMAGVQKSKRYGSIKCNSGRGSASFTGYITGCNAKANANGGYTLVGHLVSQDILLESFKPSDLVNGITPEGHKKFEKYIKEEAAKLKLPMESVNWFGILTAKTSGSLCKRISAILDWAVKIGQAYASKTAKKTIQAAIKSYQGYPRKFLMGSAGTSILFNNKFKPKAPYVNALINGYIAEHLFEGGSLWDRLQFFCSDLGLVYSPMIDGSMGKIYPQDFKNVGGSSLPAVGVLSIGVDSQSIFGGSLPASQVSMKIGSESKGIQELTISYPSSPDGDGPNHELNPSIYACFLDGSIPSKSAKEGNVQKKRTGKAEAEKTEKAPKKWSKQLKQAVLACCENTYYLLKYKNTRAHISVYYSGKGGAKPGLGFSAGGLNGVLQTLSILGNSQGRISCTAILAGVRF